MKHGQSMILSDQICDTLNEIPGGVSTGAVIQAAMELVMSDPKWKETIEGEAAATADVKLRLQAIANDAPPEVVKGSGIIQVALGAMAMALERFHRGKEA